MPGRGEAVYNGGAMKKTSTRLLPWLCAALLAVAGLRGLAVAASAPAPVPAPDLAMQLPLDAEVTRGRLANGLTYYIRQNARPEKRAELWLVVNAGSVLEDEDQRGLAHLVEHMAFAGTRHFPGRELVRSIEAIGMRMGPDLNASTGFDSTIYTLRVPTDQPEFVEKGLQILEDWAHEVSFEPAALERERKVVIEEWRLGRGAEARMRDRQLPVLLAGSRYAERLPIGTRESLERATRDSVVRFYQTWYRPDQMAVIAVGDFGGGGASGERGIDKARLEALIRRHFEGWQGPDRAAAPPRPEFPVPDHAATLFAIASDAEATSTAVEVDHKRPLEPEATAGDYRRELVEILFHSSLNGRLAEIARQGDPPFLGASVGTSSPVRPLEMDVAGARVKQGGARRGLTTLLTEIERVRRFGITASELARGKQELLRDLEEQYAERDKLESPVWSSQLSGCFLSGRALPGIEFELALARALLPGIELAEVNRLASAWSGEANRVIQVRGPAAKEAAAALPGEADLRAMFSRATGVSGSSGAAGVSGGSGAGGVSGGSGLAGVSGAAGVAAGDLQPWVDRTQDGPLLAQAPPPGTIASETRIDELGVTEWRLSNGARVVLKPTRFKNDEVLFSGWSPGGLSLLPDSSYDAGQLAPRLLREAGLGSFDQTTLRKALAGKQAQVMAFIGDFEQGVRGAASPRDLETMFQLAYLTFTAPRRDEASFASTMAKLRAAVETRLARPEAVFQDKVVAALTQDDPRQRPLTLERLREVKLETAYRIYRERFADAGQFTFFLVGNFTPQSIRPLVLTYLGGLPSAGRQESWRPVGSDAPPGIVRVEVKKGIEPKAQVEIVFSSGGKYSRENLHDLGALASLLRVRLREVLREEKGGVYGVAVNGELVYQPQERARINIHFSCAPEQAQALVQATFAEVEALRRQQVAASYAEQLQANERRERQVALQDNFFWLSVLGTYYRSGFDPRAILHHEELVARVTPERLRAAARDYLPAGRYVLATLLPDGAAAGKEAPKAGAPAAPGQGEAAPRE
jgi:zinc protease